MTPRARQFASWLVCQVCGRAAPREQSPHWLNEPHRTNLNVYVVRCPQHWSEWALRHTIVGRTVEMRRRAVLAAEQPIPTIPVALSPFPTVERPPGGLGRFPNRSRTT